MSLIRDYMPVATNAVPVRRRQKTCLSEFADTCFGDPYEMLAYVDLEKREDISRPRCVCKCCGTRRSAVLIANAVAALLHLGMFVALLTIVLLWEIDLTRPLISRVTVWQNATAADVTPACRHSLQCAIPSPKIEVETSTGKFNIFAREVEHGSLSMQWLVLSFSFLSALFQGLRPWVNNIERNLIPCLHKVFCGCCYEGYLPGGRDVRVPPSRAEVRSSYLRDVMVGVNSTRFVEYSLSATTMILAIAFTLNVQETVVYVMLGTSTAATQLVGLVAELLLEVGASGVRRELLPAAWVLHVTGWLLQVGVFYTILLSFALSSSEAETMNGVAVPDFVFAIIWSMLGLFSTFGFVQLIDLAFRTCYERRVGGGEARGCWWCTADKCFAAPARECNELAFIALSLSAKVLLSLLVASNLFLNPESD